MGVEVSSKWFGFIKTHASFERKRSLLLERVILKDEDMVTTVERVARPSESGSVEVSKTLYQRGRKRRHFVSFGPQYHTFSEEEVNAASLATGVRQPFNWMRPKRKIVSK